MIKGKAQNIQSAPHAFVYFRRNNYFTNVKSKFLKNTGYEIHHKSSFHLFHRIVFVPIDQLPERRFSWTNRWQQCE
jgi:hypothetical protein